MSVRFGLWRVDGDVRQVRPTTLSSEERLEDIIEAQIEILGLGPMLVLGRQVPTRTGKRIDLLAMDPRGDLHVVELKRDRTPRDVVAQALEYGYWIRDLSFEDVDELYAAHNDGADLGSDFTNLFEVELPEVVNSAHQLAVVATGLDTSTEQIIDYVRAYGVPINVLFFQYLKDGEREYLARSWKSDPEEPAPQTARSKKQEPWNGQDFSVVCGESQHRNWDDMRAYGFVSAGHGEKYRRAMSKLAEGSRVWVHIPALGYVGVGRVTDPAVGVADFLVGTDNGDVPILDMPLHATSMEENGEDPEQCEYLARVEWERVRDRNQAFWEKGMYANQNVVTKLRQPFTLQRLSEEFDVAPSPDQRNGHGALEA